MPERAPPTCVPSKLLPQLIISRGKEDVLSEKRLAVHWGATVVATFSQVGRRRHGRAKQTAPPPPVPPHSAPVRLASATSVSSAPVDREQPLRRLFPPMSPAQAWQGTGMTLTPWSFPCVCLRCCRLLAPPPAPQPIESKGVEFEAFASQIQHTWDKLWSEAFAAAGDAPGGWAGPLAPPTRTRTRASRPRATHPPSRADHPPSQPDCFRPRDLRACFGPPVPAPAPPPRDARGPPTLRLSLGALCRAVRPRVHPQGWRRWRRRPCRRSTTPCPCASRCSLSRSARCSCCGWRCRCPARFCCWRRACWASGGNG